MKVYPEKYLDRMKKYLSNDYEKFYASLFDENKRAIQVNTTICPIEHFVKIFPYSIEKMSYGDNIFYLNTAEKFGNSYLHLSGLIYFQEPSAMIPVESVEINEDDIVLDLCSAPGGKSCQIANKLKTGYLISNEINKNRASILKQNIYRMNYNTIITNNTPKEISYKFKNYFDKVFVDAPCSGEGMMRKDDIAINEWSEDNIQMCASRQLDILNTICDTIKVGGILIYSTCTFSISENENVIAKFLNNHPEYINVEATKEIINCTIAGENVDNITPYTRRFYPHISKGEGQFVAIMKKVSETNKSNETIINTNKTKLKNQFNSKELCYKAKSVKEFFDEYTTAKNVEFKIINNKVYKTQTDLDLTCLEIISYGLNLGEIFNERFIPSHNLFLSYCKHFKNQIKITEDQFSKYSQGLELDCDEKYNGYCSLFVNKICVGGGKCIQGKIKNYFPKYLRTK